MEPVKYSEITELEPVVNEETPLLYALINQTVNAFHEGADSESFLAYGCTIGGHRYSLTIRREK